MLPSQGVCFKLFNTFVSRDLLKIYFPNGGATTGGIHKEYKKIYMFIYIYICLFVGVPEVNPNIFWCCNIFSAWLLRCAITEAMATSFVRWRCWPWRARNRGAVSWKMCWQRRPSGFQMPTGWQWSSGFMKNMIEVFLSEFICTFLCVVYIYIYIHYTFITTYFFAKMSVVEVFSWH